MAWAEQYGTLVLAKAAFLLTRPGAMANLSAVCTHIWALCQGCPNKDLCQSRQAAGVLAPWGKAAKEGCLPQLCPSLGRDRDPGVPAARWGKGACGRRVQRNQLPPKPETTCNSVNKERGIFICLYRLPSSLLPPAARCPTGAAIVPSSVPSGAIPDL